MIDSTQPASASQQTGLTGLGGLGSEAFLRLLVAQLRYQNPMDPADGTEMLQQTAQFSTVETLHALAETQERLAGFQQVSLALSVVDKLVFAVDADGQAVSGTVSGLRFTTDGPLLQIGDTEVPLANVLSVSMPPVLPEPAGTAEAQPAGTAEAEPAGTTEAEPAGTAEAEPAGTTEAEPAGTTEAEPAAPASP